MWRKKQIFIFGYYGWGNTGDDAMLYALLQELSKFFVKDKFAILSRIPVVIPDFVKDRVRFVKPTAISVFLEIVKSHIFVIGGGTHIHDYGRYTKAIKRLLILFVLITFAKINGNKIYLIGNGIGPISTKLGKVLTKFICHLSDKITVRDRASYQLLERLGLTNTNKVSLSFDPAVILELPQEIRTEESFNKKILGICITSVFEQYYGDREKDLLIVDEIARTLNKFLAVMPELWVYLFIFKNGPRDSDVYITRILKERLKPAERIKLVTYNPDPREVLSRVAQCSAFIGTKYHSCLFAYLANIPLLIIEYHPKCRALAEELGLPRNAVISLNEIINGQLEERLEKLMRFPQIFHTTLPISLSKSRARDGIRIIKEIIVQ